MSFFDEESYEKAVLSLLENLGYDHVYGPEIERDYRVPFYEAQLAHGLMLVNPTKPAAAIDEAIRKVRDILQRPLAAGSGASPPGALRRILSFRGRSPALRGKLRNAPPSGPSARSAAPGAPAGQAGDGYLAFAGRRIEGRAASPHSSAACPGFRLRPFAKWPRWALPHAGMRRRRRAWEVLPFSI